MKFAPLFLSAALSVTAFASVANAGMKPHKPVKHSAPAQSATIVQGGFNLNHQNFTQTNVAVPIAVGGDGGNGGSAVNLGLNGNSAWQNAGSTSISGGGSTPAPCKKHCSTPMPSAGGSATSNATNNLGQHAGQVQTATAGNGGSGGAATATVAPQTNNVSAPVSQTVVNNASVVQH